jgi:hypothetical protein
MRYAWIIILLSAILGLLAALLLTISPTTVLFEPEFRAGNVPGGPQGLGRHLAVLQRLGSGRTL